ncbi:hypothetical protein C4D60_Mb06t02400 [Musa balbisiana]|uniref:Uncharacterized protein n=1 Tax=Musa balbisiana TaxID=52838 RepID=A0A4S8IKR7_MUSBA|nr:hypothetical protein C4D60_Mb06t02400 [Musa balbisiana]
MAVEEAGLPVHIRGFSSTSQTLCQPRLVEALPHALLVVLLHQLLHLLHHSILNPMVLELPCRTHQSNQTRIPMLADIKMLTTYPEEAPLLARIMEERHGFASLLSLQLSKVDHRDLHFRRLSCLPGYSSNSVSTLPRPNSSHP